MDKPQIVNIINFIRGCEPREPVDLVRPVREQIRLMEKHRLRGTFLIQYDALTDPAFTDLLKTLDPEQFEIGVWFEVVQPLTEAVGIPWRGRFPWDWHVHCGFSMGYTTMQRELLIDELYRAFRQVFGTFPRVFGSWFFDSHTARYVSDRYGADAFCNCKEQYGTDGYTLWGGYYGQGYYPSRGNIFMPAQSPERQLPVPLFRMLGPDPVYQYDLGLDSETGADPVQHVVTLEPVYTGRTGGGGSPSWVDWYLKEVFNGECLSFGYAQTGQENSFGWPAMEQGLEYQFALFAQMQAEGMLRVEPLGETGRWYKRTYSLTPASTVSAHSAHDDPEKSSLWYCSRYYRINLYADKKGLRIRDLHIFREDYPDPFETAVCKRNEAVYETLPVIDGNLMSGNGIIAGGYLCRSDGRPICSEGFSFSQPEEGTALADHGCVRVLLTEREIRIFSDKGFSLDIRIGKKDRHFPALVSQTEREAVLAYHGTEYTILLEKGRFREDGSIQSEDGEIVIAV